MAWPVSESEPPPTFGGTDRVWLGAMYVVLAAIGVMLGVIETLLVPQRLFGGVEGLSVVLALVVNSIVGSFGGLATRRIAGAVIPTIGWLIVVGAFTFYAPGGDVVIPGKLGTDPGIVRVAQVFLLVGIFAAAIAMVVTVRYGKLDYTKRVKAPTQSA